MDGEREDIWFVFWIWQILIEAHIESVGKDALTYDLLPPHVIDNMG
jgi:hypothetical protein